MTTAGNLVNTVLAILDNGSSLNASADFNSQTGFKNIVIKNLSIAQNEVIKDLKGFEPESLISIETYSITDSDINVSLPSDLLPYRLKYLYIENIEGKNIGFIRLITRRKCELYGISATGGRVCAYIDGTNLSFTEAATTDHTLKVIYVKTPAALTAYDTECDLPESLDNLILYKTMYLCMITKKKLQDALIYSGNPHSLYERFLRKVKRDIKQDFSNTLNDKSEINYYSETW